MQIVHLTSSRFFGGPERQMLGLANAMRPRFRTTFVSFSEGGLCREFLDRVRAAGHDAIELTHDTPRLRAATREVTLFLRSLANPRLFCHGYKADLIGCIAARRAKTRVVAVSRGWTYENAKVRIYEAIDRRVLRLADQVVCVSQSQAAKVRVAGVPRERISVIPNSIDKSRFSVATAAKRAFLEGLFPSTPRFIIGGAGRLSPEKGFDILIDAAEIVRRRIGKQPSDLAFIVFGDGPLRQQLADRIAERGLAPSFVLAGYRTDLDEVLPNLDLFVQSSHTEGMPNVILESLAAGVPVVATSVGGTPEIIVDKACGRLVSPNNVQELADAMAGTLLDHQARQEMARNGRARVESQFGFDAQAQAYARLCETVDKRQVAPNRRANGTTAAQVGSGPAIRGPRNPARVCFVIDNLSAAGTEKALLELIQRLDRTKVIPHLCLLDGDDATSRSLEPRNCQILRLGVRRLRKVSTLRAARQFVGFLQRERIDAVQLHFPDSTYFGAVLARLAGVRTVIRTQRNLGYWMTPFDRLLGRVLSVLTTHTIANSEACRQAVIETQGARPSSVVVIPNGVDTSRFSEREIAKSGSVEREKRVGVVANLRPIKNLAMFVHAAASVVAENPNVVFEIAGEGPCRSELETLIGRLGLVGRVRLAGAVDDPFAFISQLDVAVLCSRSEGSSNAILEYMAAARPVVATAVGGNLSVIRHESNGLLVPSDDAAALAAAIKRLLNDPSFAGQLGRNARRTAVEDYSLNCMVGRFEQFYSQPGNILASCGFAQ